MEVFQIRKSVIKILTAIFALLTFIGAGFVLFNHGKVNAGYAVVPMVFTVACLGIYRSNSKNNK